MHSRLTSWERASLSSSGTLGRCICLSGLRVARSTLRRWERHYGGGVWGVCSLHLSLFGLHGRANLGRCAVSRLGSDGWQRRATYLVVEKRLPVSCRTWRRGFGLPGAFGASSTTASARCARALGVIATLCRGNIPRRVVGAKSMQHVYLPRVHQGRCRTRACFGRGTPSPWDRTALPRSQLPELPNPRATHPAPAPGRRRRVGDVREGQGATADPRPRIGPRDIEPHMMAPRKRPWRQPTQVAGKKLQAQLEAVQWGVGRPGGLPLGLGGCGCRRA